MTLNKLDPSEKSEMSEFEEGGRGKVENYDKSYLCELNQDYSLQIALFFFSARSA